MPALPKKKQAQQAVAEGGVEELVVQLEELDRRDRQKLFEHMFQDGFHEWRGQAFHPRLAYSKHLAFLRATKHNREVGFMAANRSGKTQSGAYAVAVWATGKYPDWWEGKRFPGAVKGSVCGATNETTRDILQNKLFGDVTYVDGRKWLTGTGMIAGDLIENVTWRIGIPDTVDTVYLRHANGDMSAIGMKSYQQGQDSFMGTEQHFIWLDEEPVMGVLTECLTRTATTDGVLLATFTPLKGVSAVALRFMPGEDETTTDDPYKTTDDGWIQLTSSRCVVFCGWDDVPHLSKSTKEELLASYPAHERDARTQGIPGLGDGAVYPVPVRDVVCEPFQIPEFWPRVFGMDVGWKCTAVVWAAWDRESDVVYVYAEHYKGQQPPALHATAIKARGDWIPGVIDPASGSSSQSDGKQLLADYRGLGLNLQPANNAVEAGILQVYNRLATRRLIFFRTCFNLVQEYRLYRRKEGKIVKEKDHALDALRYMIVSGLQLAVVKDYATAHDRAPLTQTRVGY